MIDEQAISERNVHVLRYQKEDKGQIFNQHGLRS